MTSIVIIDDHPLIRESLIRALRIEGHAEIYEAGTISQGRSRIAAHNPQLILVDLDLPDGSGFELVSWARSISADIAIVVLTFHEDSNHVIAAMKAGASAYVCKSAPIPELISAINHALSSPLSFSAKNLAVLLNQSITEKKLTAREYDLLALLETGMTTKEIAERLFISQATAKTHLVSIYRKLEVKNRTSAVRVYRSSQSGI